MEGQMEGDLLSYPNRKLLPGLMSFNSQLAEVPIL
jgi:hypothetical protein